MVYYNTTHVARDELALYRKRATTQQQIIRNQFLLEAPSLTPSEIWSQTFERSCPLTSIRRAISNLTDDGFLVKTNSQRKGIYGRPEYVWTLHPDYAQRPLFPEPI